MDIKDTLFIASAGMKAQSDRLRVVAENMANIDSVSTVAGGEPYRRKTVTFGNVLNKALGFDTVQIVKRGTDNSDFKKQYDPGNPMADDQGYVQASNVNMIVEMMDMREARRTYEANLNVVEMAKSMLNSTIGLLRA
jgi:flagellar basal-body rod protein FlgC